MQHFTARLKDEAATAALGSALARTLAPGLTLYLQGDLGVGKTALVRALLHAAGHVGAVKSPTYTLVEPYRIILDERTVEVLHFDLYRMISADDFLEAGFREHFNPRTICLVEWPERADGVLPTPDLALVLRLAGDAREVELSAHSDQGFQCLSRLKFAPNL